MEPIVEAGQLRGSATATRACGPHACAAAVTRASSIVPRCVRSSSRARRGRPRARQPRRGSSRRDHRLRLPVCVELPANVVTSRPASSGLAQHEPAGVAAVAKTVDAGRSAASRADPIGTAAGHELAYHDAGCAAAVPSESTSAVRASARPSRPRPVLQSLGSSSSCGTSDRGGIANQSRLRTRSLRRRRGEQRSLLEQGQAARRRQEHEGRAGDEVEGGRPAGRRARRPLRRDRGGSRSSRKRLRSSPRIERVRRRRRRTQTGTRIARRRRVGAAPARRVDDAAQGDEERRQHDRAVEVRPEDEQREARKTRRDGERLSAASSQSRSAKSGITRLCVRSWIAHGATSTAAVADEPDVARRRRRGCVRRRARSRPGWPRRARRARASRARPARRDERVEGGLREPLLIDPRRSTSTVTVGVGTRAVTIATRRGSQPSETPLRQLAPVSATARREHRAAPEAPAPRRRGRRP